MPLAQENFAGLFLFILLLFLVLVVLGIISIVLSARGRWFGLPLAAPGMLISFATTVSFLKAFVSTTDIQWSILPFLLFPLPLLLGIVSLFVFAIRPPPR